MRSSENTNDHLRSYFCAGRIRFKKPFETGADFGIRIQQDVVATVPQYLFQTSE